MFKDYLGIISDLKIKSKNFKYFDLKKLSKKYPQILKIPYSIRILLENVIRNYDGFTIKSDHTDTIINWNKNQGKKDIPYSPSRVLMQDFTGVPAVVDLASMREAIKRKGGNPELINPLVKTDLVIDHSVNVDYFGTYNSLKKNVVGRDIKFPKPYKSDLVIKNLFDKSYKKNIKKIISLIKR